MKFTLNVQVAFNDYSSAAVGNSFFSIDGLVYLFGDKNNSRLNAIEYISN